MGIVAHNALLDQNQRSVNHRVIPRAIFTDAQIGIVGMTEKEAIAAGHRCWCRAIPMSLVPRAGAIRDTKGVIKMVADTETDEVLGGRSSLGIYARYSKCFDYICVYFHQHRCCLFGTSGTNRS
jgi:pyruvate/2-oxoglutarate dehydrogenase complex dihydrolipoamide dehydrogenase (E3) component